MKVLADQSELQIHVLDERFYMSPTKEETYYPGGTEVLSAYPKDDYFYTWLKKVGVSADEIRDFAAAEGSTVHKLIDTFLKGDPVLWTEEISLDEWKGFYRFQQFYWKYTPDTLFSEKIVVSDEYEYGGQLDYGCHFNGENWLIDHKFTTAIHKNHLLQICAYKRLIDPYFKIDRIGILHLKAQTKKFGDLQGPGWKLYEIPKEKINYYLELFDSTHKLWKEENQNFKPKNKIYPMSFNIGEEPNRELLYGTKGSDNSAG